MAPFCLAVGRLVPIKRFDWLIEAWSAMTQDRHLCIAGDGPLWQALNEQVARLGMEDRVTLLGFRSDVAQLMQSADAVISTSANEGFSYVVVEALQARCPVVSVATGVAVELLDQRFLYRVGDTSAMLAALDQVTRNPLEAAAAFAPAFNLASTLTSRAMAERTLAVYRQARGCGDQ